MRYIHILRKYDGLVLNKSSGQRFLDYSVGIKEPPCHPTYRLFGYLGGSVDTLCAQLGCSWFVCLFVMHGDFRFRQVGTFVVCAVTGEQILLENLRYWHADRQEAYATAAIALQRHQELTGRG